MEKKYCDRCGAEMITDNNRLLLVGRAQKGFREPPPLFFGSGYIDLCDSCLKDFKKFLENK